MPGATIWSNQNCGIKKGVRERAQRISTQVVGPRKWHVMFPVVSFLEGHIFGRNLFWYAAVFGTITAIRRAAVTNDHLVLDPQGAMSLLVQHTHYMPKRWRGRENSDIVRMEFEALFQYTGMMLLEDMASIFLTPYLLIFFVLERVNKILQFITDFTVDIEGFGHVCRHKIFQLMKRLKMQHVQQERGSPTDRGSKN